MPAEPNPDRPRRPDLTPLVIALALLGAVVPALAQGVGVRPEAELPIVAGSADREGIGLPGPTVRPPATSPSPLPRVRSLSWPGAELVFAQAPATALAAASVDALGSAAAPASAPTPAPVQDGRPALTEQQLRRRGALIVGGSAAALLTYGYLKWWDEGLTGRLKWSNEGWFGRGTEYGGTDKLGHAYSNALGVRLLGAVLEEAGYPRARATRLAFWSTTAAYAAIELLDGVSRRYDASLQDIAFNLLGAAGSALLMSDPGLDRLIDFRLSYSRSRFSNGWDAFGDYEGQTYWLVAKAEGVPALASNPLTRYLEVSLGYGARNFDVPAGTGLQRQRELRLAVGINLSRVFGDAVAGTRVDGSRAHRVADLAFELVQHPLRVGTRWTD